MSQEVQEPDCVCVMKLWCDWVLNSLPVSKTSAIDPNLAAAPLTTDSSPVCASLLLDRDSHKQTEREMQTTRCL